MSEEVFPPHCNPARNRQYMMTVAEAKYYKAWPQEIRDAKEQAVMHQNNMNKKNQSRKAQWNKFWYTIAVAIYVVGIDKNRYMGPDVRAKQRTIP